MLLIDSELNTYYPEAANMSAGDRAKYLGRANGYCLGFIGGDPPTVAWDPDRVNLKAVVANALEILAEGQTSQTDPVTGNITEAAPTSAFNRSDRNANPLMSVDKMLLPYKRAYEDANAASSDFGVNWLGG